MASNKSLQRMLRTAELDVLPMKMMRIQDQADADLVNEKFNFFHDGFIKRLNVTSGNEFLANMPWEQKRQFATNEDALRATGLCYIGEKTLELEIHHYNYDWPNQPSNRAIVLRASAVTEVSNDLLRFVDREIFDLRFNTQAAIMSCMLTYHEKDAGPVRSMENGITMALFLSKVIELEETTWAEQSNSAYRPPGAGSG